MSAGRKYRIISRVVALILLAGAQPVLADLSVPRVEQDSIIITTLKPTSDPRPRIVGQEIAPEGRTPAAPPPEALVEGAGDRSIQPRLAGLPEPSIIVGEQAAPALASLPRGPLGVAYAERARLRADNPETYREMVASGAFDPDAGSLAQAIQAELQRMSCYGSQVDGVWGRGSVTAVERYFQAANVRAPGNGPEIDLYRAILSGPDLTCPAPTPVATPQTTPRNTSRTSGTRRNTPAVQPSGAAGRPAVQGRPRNSNPPANPPATTTPATPPRIAPGFGGTGLFR